MKNKIFFYLKTEIKEMVLAGVILFIVLLSFAAYLKFIGLPMTRARNTYNEGMVLLMAGEKVRAKQKFIDSLSFWENTEAKTELEKLN